MNPGWIFKAIFYLTISIINIYLIYNFYSNNIEKDVILLISILIFSAYRLFVLCHKNDIIVANALNSQGLSIFNYQNYDPNKSLYPMDKEHLEDMVTSFIGFPTIILAFAGPFLLFGRNEGVSEFSIINFIVFSVLFLIEIFRRMKI